MSKALADRPISIFLLLTLLLSSIFYALIIYNGKIGSGLGLYITALMWCPAISALLTSRITGRKIAGFGWKWGQTKYQLWSYCIPLGYAFISYTIIWTIGWGKFYNTDFVSKISALFGWNQLPSWMAICFYFILTGSFGMVQKAALTLGEEIGWRGFLVPELAKKMSYTKTSIIAGIIWAVWHFPILLFADYNSGTPAWYGLSCFLIMTVSASFMLTWFRLKSGSLWTCVILHASHNLFIQSVFSPLTVDTGNTKYFIDEFGVVLPLVCFCLAIYFWKRRGALTGYKQEVENHS